MMGRQHSARDSCYNWTSTWPLCTQLPQEGRECLPSSHASQEELWSGQTPCGEKETRRWTTFEEITRRFRAVFNHPPKGRVAGERLFHLRQGTSAQEFALEFRTLAAGAGWNDRALINHYRCSLRVDIQGELACRDATISFDQLVDLSIQGALSVPSSSTPAPVPMELGGAARRETGGGAITCTICGRRGHTAGRCRVGSSGSRGNRQGTLVSPQDNDPTHLQAV